MYFYSAKAEVFSEFFLHPEPPLWLQEALYAPYTQKSEGGSSNEKPQKGALSGDGRSNGGKLSTLSEEIKHATDVIQKINTNTRSLNSIANKQKMLSLNASIEAARSGEAGVGFAVVAKSMGDLSSQSATIYSDIEKSVVEITSTIEKLASLFEEE